MSNKTASKIQATELSANKISHEINNYLSVLYSQIQYIETKHSRLAEDEDWIILKQGTKNLSSSLYHLTYPSRELPKELFILNRLVEEVYLAWKKRFQKQGNSLYYICSYQKPIQVLGCPSDFVQIMNNLLSNSYDAVSNISSDGKVIILLKCYRNQIILQIEDNGCGIAPQDLEHIFEYGISKKQNGHGIGLAVVKELVQKNQGYIFVDSKPEQGTSFHLAFSIH